ncbi:MAG: copper uptake system-associated protein [Aestuariivirga sp.]|uniref:copper uptake system-associated protein n=1 Tax=Aestuariivirga sp. TaxID=2650926 RepID=UPI0025B7D1DE|nr:copper uptake system-associated protein [Aestuariivirga sp.]MCA3559888.1 copper uptake system-associated protein [Aestuariivirga sp.]
MMNTTRRAVLAASLVLGLLPNVVLAHDDQHEIIHLMKGMFDTPENPLSVEPVVVIGDNAIAGWVQGERGGRALLWRVDGQWKIRLCSGDSLKDPKFLESANISAADATTLAAQLAAAESKLDPAVLAKFSSFEGTMMIDPKAGHGGHKHGSTTTP